jgi:hypothetical protein
MGWISFGTTTKPLPTTSIAPALFAVPKWHTQNKIEMLPHEEENDDEKSCLPQ